MPRTVKLFLGLCLIYVAWLVWANIGFLLFPAPQRLAMLAHLPAHYRAIAERGDWIAAAMRIGIMLVFFLTFALTAALGRKNWARWTLAILLIATEFTSLVLFTYIALRFPVSQFGPEFTWNGQWQIWLHQWVYWQSWAWLGLKLALIATIFAPGSRGWYRRPAIVAPTPDRV